MDNDDIDRKIMARRSSPQVVLDLYMEGHYNETGLILTVLSLPLDQLDDGLNLANTVIHERLAGFIDEYTPDMIIINGEHPSPEAIDQARDWLRRRRAME